MFENPVFIKEIKTKMRSRQPVQVQIVIVGLIVAFLLWCYYEAIVYLTRYGGPSTGQEGWQLAVGLQAILIWMLSPALTANAISQEKEQQTWEMLVFTRLTPVEILLGKLTARLLPMLLLFAAFFPFTLFCHARANLPPVDFALVYFHFGVWTVFMATVGLFMSWAFRRTAVAVALAYLVLFLLVIGTLLIEVTLSLGYGPGDSLVLWLNPVRITTALVSRENDANASGVLTFSALIFAVLPVFLFWRMISRFRAFEV